MHRLCYSRRKVSLVWWYWNCSWRRTWLEREESSWFVVDWDRKPSAELLQSKEEDRIFSIRIRHQWGRPKYSFATRRNASALVHRGFNQKMERQSWSIADHWSWKQVALSEFQEHQQQQTKAIIIISDSFSSTIRESTRWDPEQFDHWKWKFSCLHARISRNYPIVQIQRLV